MVNWTVQLGLALQRPSSDFVSRHLVVAILHPRTLASRIPESTCTSTTDVVVSTQEVEYVQARVAGGWGSLEAT